MDVQYAAVCTLEHFSKIGNKLPERHPWYGKLHIYEMLDKIASEEITGEQAHRWLGWAQCAICMGDALTLDELKEINHNA